MRCVLLLAAGAEWETDALEVLDRASGTVVLKRCVDLDDLLASATTGQAEYAVIAVGAVGLDAAAVAHLVRYGLRPVVVQGAAGPGGAESGELVRRRLGDMGVAHVVSADEVRTLPEVLSSQPVELEQPTPVPAPAAAEAAPGRVVAVWGPVGAPGRTTVAVGLAGELARRKRHCLLVDADPHAAVAQHLGVLDQISGLLSAARVARSGDLVDRLPGLYRGVVDGLALLTGVPRPDRAAEVEPGVLADVVDACRSWGDVVVDCGWELAEDTGPARAGVKGLAASEVVEVADALVVVGSADPVGLARLARSLVDLRDHVDGLPVHVVVNRMRPSLGWSNSEVTEMVGGFVSTESVHLLPDDRAGTDRALVAGRPVTLERGSALAHGIAEVLDAVHPAARGEGDVPRAIGAWPWLRQRRAGTARLR